MNSSCVITRFLMVAHLLGIGCANGRHYDLLGRGPQVGSLLHHTGGLCVGAVGACTEGAVGRQAGDSWRSLMPGSEAWQLKPPITFPGLLQSLEPLFHPLPLTMMACFLSELLAGGGSILHISLYPSHQARSTCSAKTGPMNGMRENPGILG